MVTNGSVIYKSLLLESGTMTQDMYMNSVLDRAGKNPKWLHYFFQKDCKDGVRGRLGRVQTLQILSSVSMLFISIFHFISLIQLYYLDVLSMPNITIKNGPLHIALGLSQSWYLFCGLKSSSSIQSL